MKIERNTNYLTLAIYIFLTSMAIVAATLCLFNINEVLYAVGKVLSLLYDLLRPLIYGIIIAYLLDPIVCFYDKKCRLYYLSKYWQKVRSKSRKSSVKKERMPMRTWATLFTFLTLLLVLGLFILVVSMNVQDMIGSTSITDLTLSYKRYLAYFESMMANVEAFIGRFVAIKGNGAFLQKIYGYLNSFIVNLTHNIMSSMSAIGIGTMNWLLALVIAFYLLQDKVRALALLKKATRSIFKSKIYRHIEILGKDIDYVFSGYIRGQILDAIIIAILTSIALTTIGLDFAIIIGIISGIFNLIPYFGPIVGFVLAGLIGIMDPNPMKAIYGMLAILVIQQLDGWIIVPKVVGECVKLHPVVVLLAILIGGNLFGLVGMLLGVPVAGFIRLVLLRYMTDLFPNGETILKEEEMAHQEVEQKEKE